MSVRKRGERWVAQVYDPQTRGRVWVGTYPTRQEAKIAEGEAWKHARARKGVRVETVGSFAGRWTDDYPRQRESTAISYRGKIAMFARHFGHRPLRSIDRVEARAWALQNRSTFPAARAMYSDAVKDGLADTNPFTNLRLEQSRGRKDLVVPTVDELAGLVLQAARTWGGYNVVANFIQLGAYSGLRAGELYGLRWSDFDFEGRTLLVERQFNGKTRTFTETKSGRARRIFLTREAEDAAKATARIRPEVFFAPRGGRLSGTAMSHYWKPVVNAVGRPDFTPHCLRHFYGTLLARNGMQPYDIAQQLGHTDKGETAMARYIHTTEADSNEKAARIFGANVRNLKAVENG